MANAYCTLAQLEWLVDTRATAQISNDSNSNQANQSNLQALLDIAASDLVTVLTGRVALPLTSVPPILTRWVGAKAAELIYGRRGDLPKQVKTAVEWADQWAKDFIAGKVTIGDRLGPDALCDDSATSDLQRSNLTESL